MKIFKKILATILCVVMVFGSAPLSGFMGLESPSLTEIFNVKAKAETSGVYTYIIKFNRAEITDVSYISGNIVIPSTLDGYPVTSIGDYAFHHCHATSISIPYGVKSIGENAFAYCEELKEIIIPDSVTSIDDRSFYNCTSLENVAIPDSVTSISNYAFSYCTSLESVTIPDSVTFIGYDAFSHCTSLKNITIPGSIKKIGESTFSYCTSLENVTINNGVTRIDEDAFLGCPNLASIIIPDSVTSIGSRAFASCTSPLNIEISKNLTEIGYDAFSKSVCYFENSGYYIDDYLISAQKDASGEFVIKDGTKAVADYVLRYYKNITKVIIPDSVQYIGNDAFANCENLSRITIGKNVKKFGAYAFYECYKLSDVYYEGSISSWCDIDFVVDHSRIGQYSNPIRYADNFYINGTLVEEIVIPEDVTEINSFCFNYYEKLKKVTLGNNVKKIGSYAFYGCISLENLKMGSNVTYIDSYAFARCRLINNSITIPQTLTKIGDGAFEECWGLTDVYYEGDLAGWCSISFEDSDSNPLSKSDNLFIDGELLFGTVYINDVSSIGNYAFYSYNGFEKVIILDNVTQIGEQAFYECVNLTEITLSDNITQIGEQAFYRCVNLTEIILPDNIPKINEGVFHSCSYVKSVRIGKKTTFIDKNAFYGCSKISEVYYPGTVEEWNEITFAAGNDAIRSCKIVFDCYSETPNAGKGVLESGHEWLITADNELLIKGEGEMTDFTTSTAAPWVKNNVTIKKIMIDRNVTDIGDYAFNGLTDVEKIYYDGNAEEWSMVSVGEGNSILENVTFSEYLLTWIVDGNEYADYVSVGSKIRVPEISEKTGYSFVWIPAPPNVMPENNLTVTGTYAANKYNAIFDANGGVLSYGESGRIVATEYGAEILSPENPTKQGYVFSKWIPEVGIMDDVNGKTFTAEWIASTETVYTVETYTMNTSGEYEKSIQSFKGTTGEKATAKYNVSPGFKFNAAKSMISGVIAADNSLVLKVYIDRNAYKFTTVVDDVSSSTKFLYGSMISEPIVPSKPGYKFVGWDKTIPSKMPANDLTVTAVFELSLEMVIRNPSTTTISYGDSIILNADTNEVLPIGWKIYWTASNNNFGYKTNGTTCTISPEKSGDTTFTATLHDANGNPVSTDEQTMTSKAGFFDKIIAFFKGLFGLSKTYPNVFKGIF